MTSGCGGTRALWVGVGGRGSRMKGPFQNVELTVEVDALHMTHRSPDPGTSFTP